MKATSPPNRIDDTIRFYEILARIENRVGGCRILAECDGKLKWPRRGVYFFFELGEQRSLSGEGARVVRVGTHAITKTSRTTLWKRLSQHRGPVKSGGGNHRGSVFRKLIGIALAQRGDSKLPKSWGHGSSYSGAARKLNLTGSDVKSAEADLERCVSDYVRQMPFLWLNVDDAPSPDSNRKYIERNAIALLSHAQAAGADVPSKQWLGKYCDRPLVQASGLWNNEHVEEDYDAKFLDVMGELVDAWV